LDCTNYLARFSVQFGTDSQKINYPSLIPWIFHEDFQSGIAGWISFPLPQDVGFDPSLYVGKVEGSPVLVRNVISRSEDRLRVGLLRQLHFLGTPASIFEVTYRVEVGGAATGASLVIVSADGRKYETAIPPGHGQHSARISGDQLHLLASGVEVEAVVIEMQVFRPVGGSNNRLTIQSLSIEGKQRAGVALRWPHVAVSPGSGMRIASQVITSGTPAQIEFEAAGDPGILEVTDDVGVVSKEKIPAGANSVLFPEQIRASPGLWRATISRGAERSEFRFLVVNNTPAHPRVLLSRTRIEQLRSHQKAQELEDIIHRRATQLALSIDKNVDGGTNIPELSGVSPFPGLAAYFRLMEDFSNAIGYNALDFCLTGNRRALDVTRRTLLAVSQWPTWTPPWFPAHGLHTYYEVGVATQEIALGYDLIADQLTLEERSQIITGLWRNSIQPTLDDYFFNDRIPVEASNHEAQSVGGALAAVVATYGDVPAWDARLGAALAELTGVNDRLLNGLFPGDGSEAEPGGYQNFAMQGLSFGIAALRAFGIHPAGADKMAQSFWWLRYAEVTPGVFLDTGDFDGELKGLSGFAWGAEYSGSPELRIFYDSASDLSLGGLFRLPATATAFADTGRALEQAPNLLDLVCCSQPEPAAAISPPPSRLFPKRGSAGLRSGWGSDDTVISIRVGPWFNHEHHDQGSFQVAAFGERLIGEAGYSDYYKDPHYSDYFSEAPGHNTVLLDGNSFSQSPYDGPYWPAFHDYPRFTSSILSDAVDYIAANLKPAYGNALELFRREYLFLKPDILIVHDRLESSNPRRYDWLLHVPVGLRVSQDGSNALIQGKSASATVAAASPDLHWLIESTPIPIVEYSEFDSHRILPRQQIKLISALRTKADFLVGIRFADASLENAPLHPIAASSFEGFSGSIVDRKFVVVFRTHGGRLVNGSVSTDGDVLAVLEKSKTRQIFVSGAQSLQVEQREVLSASSPVNFVLQLASRRDTLQVTTAKSCLLRVLAQGRPEEVTVDGKTTTASLSGELVIVKVPEGDHRVSIRY
jgi:hypothetical protein